MLPVRHNWQLYTCAPVVPAPCTPTLCLKMPLRSEYSERAQHLKGIGIRDLLRLYTFLRREMYVRSENAPYRRDFVR